MQLPYSENLEIQYLSSIPYFQDQAAYPKAFKYVNNRDWRKNKIVV